MLTKEEADQLIECPKISIDKKKEHKDIDVLISGVSPVFITMLSLEDKDMRFVLHIKQSPKMYLKLTLHFQTVDNSIPLIRIDYGAGHKNPEISTNNVPNTLIQYQGKRFENNEAHIHYYVEGYALRWAIPLSQDGFPIKSIDSLEDIKKAILAMGNLVNLQTKLHIDIQEEAL